MMVIPEGSANESSLDAWLSAARRLARRWCDSTADADDVAQEAVVRLLRHNPLPCNLWGWLFVVTRRIAARAHERDVRRTHAESAFASQPACTGDPDLLLDIGRILASMSPRERALLLRVAEGVQSRDIAAELGCQTRDVGQLVSRARRKARRKAGEPSLQTRPVRNRRPDRSCSDEDGGHEAR